MEIKPKLDISPKEKQEVHIAFRISRKYADLVSNLAKKYKTTESDIWRALVKQSIEKIK